MEEKKESIEEIRERSIKKRRYKEAALASILLIGLVIGGIYVFKPNFSNKDIKTVDYDKEIEIASSIRPFSTSVGNNGTIKIANNRSREVKLTFETNQIREVLTIEPSESAYFNASEYENVPRTNYFNLDNGDTGQIIIRD